MSGEFSTAWLTLREPADADARAADLLEALHTALGDRAKPVIRDLGCGAGSLSRWLGPKLGGPHHWVLEDRDPDLLAYAAAHPPPGASVETRVGDVTQLTAADLDGTDLVTCSALLDLLTADEVAELARVCAQARCAALFTLSVVGKVSFDPADPRDAAVTEAFNAHQRRTVDGRRLLGPDAPEAAAAAFAAHGAKVTVRPSPWRLGPERATLTEQWLQGWVGAAAEQQPELGLDAYLDERLAALRAGNLRATVGHADLLAIFN
ncbi:class I SAM-dependent methyltransferase [Krasilnikovia sp. MM14-A1259]|uniref:class I SAM-dependent methyltransferase n=1 Tax=Krasilnikovia sp. MM14-A1259 TaxID=3373539 RepID=UPI0037F1B20C